VNVRQGGQESLGRLLPPDRWSSFCCLRLHVCTNCVNQTASTSLTTGHQKWRCPKDDPFRDSSSACTKVRFCNESANPYFCGYLHCKKVLLKDDGFEVFVGTDAGAIYELLSGASCSQSVSLACATMLQLTVDAPQQGTGSVDAMVAFAPPGSSAIAFAVYNVNGTGYVLRWTGQTFHAVGGSRDNNLPYTAIDAIATGGLGTAIFLASNASVYSSYDFGNSWRIASDGLPFVAQAVDMHAIHHTDGRSYLYLATYGWSLWRAVLPFSP
jgi:hypothetical protein